MSSTDKQMGYQCLVSFFNLQDLSQTDNNEIYMKIHYNDYNITSAFEDPPPPGKCIITGNESRVSSQYRAKPGVILVNVK
ncbi:Eukaryotic translation initiation factor 3 subunit I [Plecturocebus cupreus]